jgi:hypothetical protein
MIVALDTGCEVMVGYPVIGAPLVRANERPTRDRKANMSVSFMR